MFLWLDPLSLQCLVITVTQQIKEVIKYQTRTQSEWENKQTTYLIISYLTHHLGMLGTKSPIRTFLFNIFSEEYKSFNLSVLTKAYHIQYQISDIRRPSELQKKSNRKDHSVTVQNKTLGI